MLDFRFLLYLLILEIKSEDLIFVPTFTLNREEILNKYFISY